MRHFRSLIAAAVLILLPLAVQAQSFRDAERSFLFSFENDVLDVPSDQNDDAYTQGLRLLWSFEYWPDLLMADRDSATSLAAKLLPLPGGSCFSRAQIALSGLPCGGIQLGFGQTIFTPDDLLSTERLRDDRPYAAWLFGIIGIDVLSAPLWQPSDRRKSLRTLLSVSNYSGFTGALSLGKQLQNYAHWTFAFGAPRVMGWDNQLASAFQTNFVASYRPRLEICDDDCSDLSPQRWLELVVPIFTAEYGTLMRRAGVGGTIRIGRNLPETFGIDRLPVVAPPALTGRSDQRLPSGQQRESYQDTFGFGGGLHYERRWVAHNAFIEGSYADEVHGAGPAMHDVRAATPVDEYGFTALLRPWPTAYVTYHAVWRTSEIHGRDRSDTFGIIQLTILPP